MPAVTVKTQTRDEVPQSTRLVDVGHRQRSANMVSTRRNNWSELRRYLQNFQGQRIVDQFRACSRNEKVIIVGALAQATIVALLQALILALEKLPDLDSSRRSYIFFFFFVCCAGLVQAVFGILTTSLTELSTVLLLNVLSVIYASLQVSELWSDNVDPNSTVVVLAAISCAVLAIIVLVDAVVLAHLYETFAEAVYSRIGSDAAIQSMYHSFKAMGAVSTLLTILNTVFVFVHLVIYLPKGDYEAPILAVALITNIVLVTLLRTMKRFHLVIRIHLCFLLLLTMGYLYKVIVFDLRTCSFCQDVPNMLFLSFSAAINMLFCITAIGVTVRCISTFNQHLTSAPGLSRTLSFKQAAPLPLANRRVDSVPDRLRVRSNSAFVTSEFRFQRVSSHRSRLASMLGAAGLRTSNMGSRPNTAPAPHTSLTSRLRHSNSPL